MTNPDYKSYDGREWISEAITRVGGARRIFRARCLEPCQLEGLDEDLSLLRGGDVGTEEISDQKYRIRRRKR